LVIGQGVFAQQNKTSSDYYPITIHIEKIYPYRLGYVVAYRNGPSLVNAYIPNQWFVKSAEPDAPPPKAEKFTVGAPEWPHMSVYYRDGQFDHVRLYVRKERGHESWGSVSASVNIDDKFEGAEDLAIEYR
jgi:hypothetical protein